MMSVLQVVYTIILLSRSGVQRSTCKLHARGGEPGDEATKHVRFSNTTTITPVPSPTLNSFQVLYINERH